MSDESVAESQDAEPPAAGQWTWSRALIAVLAVGAIAVAGYRIWTELAPETRTATVAAGTMPAPPMVRRGVTPDQFNTDNLIAPKERLIGGGPPKDGIPALTDPKTVAAKDVTFLDDDDRLIVLTVSGRTHAYPIALLNFHEIVNDDVAEQPIAVVYCPLCDSASVVDRRIGDKTLEFGVSGLLYNSNVVMYDRTDQALWSQVRLTALSGPHAGQSLKHLPFEITTFAQLKAAHPDAPVATFETGYFRPYQRNPYQGYFETDGVTFPVDHRDERMANKTPVIGVKLGDEARAYAVDAIRAADGGRLTDTIGQATVVLQADEHSVRIVESPADAQVVHTFWFAWVAFHPDTHLHGHPATQPAASQPASSQPDAAR